MCHLTFRLSQLLFSGTREIIHLNGDAPIVWHSFFFLSQEGEINYFVLSLHQYKIHFEQKSVLLLGTIQHPVGEKKSSDLPSFFFFKIKHTNLICLLPCSFWKYRKRKEINVVLLPIAVYTVSKEFRWQTRPPPPILSRQHP